MDQEYKKKYEEMVLNNISKFGWHCTSVHEDEGKPSFTYSIGLYKTYGQAELILFGLSSSLSHEILSFVAEEYSKGKTFDLRKPIEGILEGFSCKLVAVPHSEAKKYSLSAFWYYKDKPFPLHQIVWPSSTDGLFPWDGKATEEFKREQPVLGAVL